MPAQPKDLRHIAGATGVDQFPVNDGHALRSFGRGMSRFVEGDAITVQPR